MLPEIQLERLVNAVSDIGNGLVFNDDFEAPLCPPLLHPLSALHLVGDIRRDGDPKGQLPVADFLIFSFAWWFPYPLRFFPKNVLLAGGQGAGRMYLEALESQNYCFDRQSCSQSWELCDKTTCYDDWGDSEVPYTLAFGRIG